MGILKTGPAAPVDEDGNRAGLVEREKQASDARNVLAESYRVKRRFFHCTVSPTMQRMEACFARMLADVSGKRVLEIGCGEGDTSLHLLDRGARVWGIDISDNYVAAARSKMSRLGDVDRRCSFDVMDAHNLEFGDGAFDLVIGRGVLHHLDIGRAIQEVHRVLAVGGTACFIEPLGGNPMLKLFRWLTPAARTPDERPLDRDDLDLIAGRFGVSHQFFGLISAPVAMGTSIALRPWPDNFLLRWADRCEVAVNRWPAARTWNQYVLIRATRA